MIGYWEVAQKESEQKWFYFAAKCYTEEHINKQCRETNLLNTHLNVGLFM